MITPNVSTNHNLPNKITEQHAQVWVHGNKLINVAYEIYNKTIGQKNTEQHAHKWVHGNTHKLMYKPKRKIIGKKKPQIKNKIKQTITTKERKRNTLTHVLCFPNDD